MTIESGVAVVGIRLENLKPEVRSYVQKLRASLQVVYDKYQVANRDELAAKVRKGIVIQEDIDKALKLISVINDCGRKNEINIIERLFESEKEKLEFLFERPIEIPPLPKEATLERIKEWEKKRLGLHYLPDADMDKEYGLKYWTIPDPRIILSHGRSGVDMKLPGCWVLCDERPQPSYNEGNSYYEDDEDFLAPVMEDLRARHVIDSDEQTKRSRFGIAPRDLEKLEVVASIAQAFGLKPEQVTLPHMIEFNVLANLHREKPNPYISRSECSEWFADTFEPEELRLVGGANSVADVNWVQSHAFHHIGFRFIGRFKPQS